jgi:ABC-2 type transport system ATP-binding protein
VDEQTWLTALAGELRRRGMDPRSIDPALAGRLVADARPDAPPTAYDAPSDTPPAAYGTPPGAAPTAYGTPPAAAPTACEAAAGAVHGAAYGAAGNRWWRGPVRLDVRDVTKRYRGRTVLSGVNLTVHAGEVAAIVGANGCGKSTLLRICAGLLSPDQGLVRITGALGYCPQDAGTCEFLTPDEHFVLVGAGRGLDRAAARRAGRAHAAALDWAPPAGTQARHLSGGTRQKLNLVMAGLGDPDVLLLDEPYQGFDRGSYLDFWQEIWRWRDAGKAIVVVTHLLSQLDGVDTVLDLGTARGVAA